MNTGEKKINPLIRIIDCMSLLCSIVLFFAMIDNPMLFSSIVSGIYQNTYSVKPPVCNMSLAPYDYTVCVYDDVLEKFNYSETRFWYKDDIDDGGDCLDYSLYYCSQVKQRGLNCRVNIDITLHHAFAIASNDSFYCILDMKEIACLRFYP